MDAPEKLGGEEKRIADLVDQIIGYSIRSKKWNLFHFELITDADT